MDEMRTFIRRAIVPALVTRLEHLAGAPGRAECCRCPHVDYLTTDVGRHRHHCDSCGDDFVDATREKRYFGHPV